MRPRLGGWATAAGSAAVLLLLLLPIDLAPGGHAKPAAYGAAHVLLFALLAWMWGHQLPRQRRGWPLWLAVAATAATVEVLQSWFGRSAEVVDWLYGSVGAAWICVTWRMYKTWLRVAGVLVVALFPLVWEVAMVAQEAHAFPVLATPDARWAGRGWLENGGQLRREAAGFRFSLDLEQAKTEGYPGVFREPAVREWRQMEALESAIYWPKEAPAIMGLRVDDRRGNPSYAERFQREFAVTQGWNQIRIAVEELSRTSAGQPFHLEHVVHWGVFLVSDVTVDYFLIRSVQLTMPKEQP